MTFTPRPLADGQLANSKGTLYTCPTGFRARVTLIRLFNEDGTAKVCRLYVKPGSTSRAIFRQSIPTLEFVVASDQTTTIYLDEGDLIEGYASTANVVDYFICGEEEQKGA